MAAYNLYPIFKPQFIAAASTALAFAPAGATTTVPVNYSYEISQCWVTNVTSSPVALTLWLVPNGASADNEHLINPVTVLIPVASNSNPAFSVSQLWGEVLPAGWAVFAQAGSANALTIKAAGAVVQG